MTGCSRRKESAQRLEFGWGVDTGADQLESCTVDSGCQKGLTTGHLYNPECVQVEPSTGDIYVSSIGGVGHFKPREVLADGFESGSVGGWSSSVGSI